MDKENQSFFFSFKIIGRGVHELQISLTYFKIIGGGLDVMKIIDCGLWIKK
jgi:hypothetical protein